MKKNISEDYLPYGRHKLTEEDINEVLKVLKSPFLTQGPVVPKFEKEFAEKVSCREAIAVNSATSGLHLGCLALGLSKGDYLWTSPISFVASANCGLYCGANIDFVDIDPSTGLMCLKELTCKLEKAAKNNSLPKVIVPVHLSGASCDMREIYKLSLKYGFYIIEDASHAIGGKYCDQPIGNCKYCDITVFSLHPVKIITTGEGGIITTNKTNIAKKIRMLRTHGITKDPLDFRDNKKVPWHYEQQYLGFNYRLSDMQAALGSNQLKRLDQIIMKRNEYLNIYKNLLKSLPLSFLQVPDNVLSSVHLCIIRLGNNDPKFHKYVFEGLRASNIGVQLHYQPIHLQPYYKDIGFKKGDYPMAELYATNSISLPLFIDIKPKDQIRVADKLKELLDANSF